MMEDEVVSSVRIFCSGAGFVRAGHRSTCFLLASEQVSCLAAYFNRWFQAPIGKCLLLGVEVDVVEKGKCEGSVRRCNATNHSAGFRGEPFEGNLAAAFRLPTSGMENVPCCFFIATPAVSEQPISMLWSISKHCCVSATLCWHSSA